MGSSASSSRSGSRSRPSSTRGRRRSRRLAETRVLDSHAYDIDRHSRDTIELPPMDSGRGSKNKRKDRGTTIRLLVSEAFEEARRRGEYTPSDRKRGVGAATRKIGRAVAQGGTFTTVLLRKSWNASSRRLRAVIVLMTLIAAGASGVAVTQYAERLDLEQRVSAVMQQREARSTEIAKLDARLAQIRDANPDSPEVWALLAEIAKLEAASQADERALARRGVDPARVQSETERRLGEVFATFGAEGRDIPVACVERVDEFLKIYTGRARGTANVALSRAREHADAIGGAFKDNGLPVDLACIAAVESVFNPDAQNSGSGATGMWQFVSGTARDMGLMNNGRDDRRDPGKSTSAAARYLSDLVAVFGARDVELAIGSYNCGDGRMRGILKRIDRPCDDRSFWTCYRMGWLPRETADYVPKVLAYMLIFRDPQHYGFDAADPFAAAR